MLSFQDFEKIDLRSGTILEAILFIGAKKPAFQLHIDFGSFGIKKSSAQLTNDYTIEQLVGMQIIAVVNLKPKQIANFISECLVLGVVDHSDQVVLLQPQKKVKNGLSIK